jgi:hypothetical protein
MRYERANLAVAKVFYLGSRAPARFSGSPERHCDWRKILHQQLGGVISLQAGAEVI